MVLMREEQTPQIAPKCRSWRRKEREGEFPVRASCSICCPAGDEEAGRVEVPWACHCPGKKRGEEEKEEEEEEKEKGRRKRRSLGKRDMQRGWRASVCGVQGPEGNILMKGKVDMK